MTVICPHLPSKTERWRVLVHLALLMMTVGCISDPQFTVHERAFQGVLQLGSRWSLDQYRDIKDQIERIEVHGKGLDARVTCHLDRAPVHEVLVKFLQEAEVPHLMEQIRLQGNICLSLEKIPLKRALEALLSDSEAEAVWMPNAQGAEFVVLRNARPSNLPTAPSTTSLSPIIRSAQLHHHPVSSLHTSLFSGTTPSAGLFPATGGAVQIGMQTDTNRFYFRGPQEDVQQCLRMVRQADQPQPQILLELYEMQIHPNSNAVRITTPFWAIETLKNNLNVVSTDRPPSLVGTVTLSHPGTAPDVIAGGNTAPLRETSAIEAVARCGLVVAPGQPASMAIGVNGYLLVSLVSSGLTTALLEQITTGLQLSLTPFLLPNGHFQVQISSSVSRFVSRSLFTLVANTTSQSVSTTLQVPNGGFVILGGSVSPTTNQEWLGPLWLRGVPGMAWIYGSTVDLAQRIEVVYVLRLSLWKPQLGFSESGTTMTGIPIPAPDEPHGIPNISLNGIL
ncbi:MAG: hypothetical protein ACOYKZ_03145 [Chlamydiia bacterium]